MLDGSGDEEGYLGVWFIVLISRLEAGVERGAQSVSARVIVIVPHRGGLDADGAIEGGKLGAGCHLVPL